MFRSKKRIAYLSQVGGELLRDRRLAAPSIATKMLLARAVWGINFRKFLMLGLNEQPMDRWRDSLDFGTGLDPVLRIVNWHGDGSRLCMDKLTTAERLAKVGLPSPPLIACIGRDNAAYPHAGLCPQWSSADEIARALPSCPDHLFVKPAAGAHGNDIYAVERQDRGWAVSGETMSDRALAEHLLKKVPPAGLLVQERLRSHRGLAPIGGELGLPTLRITTALMEDGPEILFGFGKILRAKSDVDNFNNGKFGNMKARLDLASGRITEVAWRRPDQRFLLEPVTEHPATGTPLVGFQLPLWEETVALALRLAGGFPECPLVGSDIAITPDGPVIIEINSNWDANAAELAMGRGLRPVLREVIPRLALNEAAKKEALAFLAISSHAMRKLPRLDRYEDAWRTPDGVPVYRA